MIYKFYSPKCLPCKQLTTFLDHKGIEVVSIDVTDAQNAALVERFEIMSVPVLINDETLQKVIGFNPIEVLSLANCCKTL